jgi:hypothetical protein
MDYLTIKFGDETEAQLDIKKVREFYSESYFAGMLDFCKEERIFEAPNILNSELVKEVIKQINETKDNKTEMKKLINLNDIFRDKITETLDFLLMPKDFIFIKQKVDIKYEIDFTIFLNRAEAMNIFKWCLKKYEEKAIYPENMLFWTYKNNNKSEGIEYSNCCYYQGYDISKWSDTLEQYYREKYKDPRLKILTKYNYKETYLDKSKLYSNQLNSILGMYSFYREEINDGTLDNPIFTITNLYDNTAIIFIKNINQIYNGKTN